jgi:hypothetical protein
MPAADEAKSLSSNEIDRAGKQDEGRIDRKLHQLESSARGAGSGRRWMKGR